MARRTLDVRIGTRAVPVGTLIVDGDGNRAASTFIYHRSWIDHPAGFALSPHLPLGEAPFHRRKTRSASCLPGPVDDGAPDSWGRKIIEKTSGSARLGDLDYLTEASDLLRTGALRYYDGPGPDARALAEPPEGFAPGVPRLHHMDAVIRAARAFEASPETYAAERAGFIGGDALRDAVGSLGGARPKVNAIDEAGALWIVKLPKQSDTYAMAQAEALALRLARDAGINAAEAYVMNDAPHFPMIRVRRFDRAGPGSLTRVPYISAQTFMGEDPEAIWSYEDIAHLMRSHASGFRDEIRELYRRMVFTILIRNTDDHLRNHGFLRHRSGWRLSPAFDINPEHRSGGMLQTPISGIHGAVCSIEAALDACLLFDIGRPEAREIIKRTAQVIQSGWRPIGRSLGMGAREFSVLGTVIENHDLETALAY